MGLFDLFRKNKQGAAPEAPARETPAAVKKPKPSKKRPETFEELIDDILINPDRELLREDTRMLSSTLISVGDIGMKYVMMSDLLERAVEAPRAEINYEYLTEHILCQYRMFLGDRDPTYLVPLEILDRFCEDVVKLYQQCGAAWQEKIERYSTELYNIPCSGARKLYELWMEEGGEKRKAVLRHLKPIKTEDVLYFLLDYIVKRLDDPSDAERKEIRDFIKENVSPIVLFNTGEIIEDNRVQDVPEFFRRIYLKICGREGDEELISRFNEFWEA